jgi:hypothetical protein
MKTQLTGAVNVAAQSIWSESENAMHNIGELIYTNDGRAFRYSKCGATAFVPGQLYQAPAEDTTNMQALTATIPVVGATSVVTTSTVTLTANQLADGFLVFATATTNAGQMYRIEKHAAATAAVATFTLADEVQYLATGTLTIDVHPHPYKGTIVMPTTSTSAPVGVACFKVTAEYHGWLQTHGPAAVLAQGTVTVGDGVIPAETTNAGSVVSQGNDTHDAEVGYALTGIASTAYGIVFLTID